MRRYLALSILAALVLLALAGPAAASGEDSGLSEKTGTASFGSGTISTPVGPPLLTGTSNKGYYLIYNATRMRYTPVTLGAHYAITYRNDNPTIFAAFPKTSMKNVRFMDGTNLIFTADEHITKLYTGDYFSGTHFYHMVFSVDYNNFVAYPNTSSMSNGLKTIIIESNLSTVNTGGWTVNSTAGDTLAAFYLGGQNAGTPYQIGQRLGLWGGELNSSYHYAYGSANLANEYHIVESDGGAIKSYEITRVGITNPATQSKLIAYNALGTIIYSEDEYQSTDTSGAIYAATQCRIVLDNGITSVVIWDDIGGDIGDTFHIAIRDASTGALISSPTVNITELSTGATWGYVPADGVQTSDSLMAGLLYNISATKTGYFGDWQNFNLVSGCIYPVCYGNNVELRLVKISTPADTTKTTAAFKVYFQDTAYQGDQPVSGATITLSSPGYTDLLGQTNSLGFRDFTINKSVEYSYTITKTGYYAASGTFNITDPTPILVRMYLAPQGTPTVTTLPTPPVATTPADETSVSDSSRKSIRASFAQAATVAGPLFLITLILFCLAAWRKGMK
ncbi:MAG: hypothetical protein WC683_15690 [bacterium]